MGTRCGSWSAPRPRVSAQSSSRRRRRGASPRTSAGSLDIFPYRNMIPAVASEATTADAFNAVAEPRRRQILDVLAGGERPVNDIVRALGVAQPQVSKHLRVL